MFSLPSLSRTSAPKYHIRPEWVLHGALVETSDECSRESGKVVNLPPYVNLHTRPVCVITANIGEVEREPIQNGAVGSRHQPIQPNAGKPAKGECADRRLG